MRNFLLGVVTGIVLFLLCAALYLRLGFAEIRGDLGPSAIEDRLMTAAVHASVRRRAPEVPAREEVIRQAGDVLIYKLAQPRSTHPLCYNPFSPAWFRGNDVIPSYGQVLITNQQNSP